MFLCTLATKWAKIYSIYSKITKLHPMFRDFFRQNHTPCLGIFLRKSHPFQWHTPVHHIRWVPQPPPPPPPGGGGGGGLTHFCSNPTPKKIIIIIIKSTVILWVGGSPPTWRSSVVKRRKKVMPKVCGPCSHSRKGSGPLARMAHTVPLPLTARQCINLHSSVMPVNCLRTVLSGDDYCIPDMPNK